MLLFSLNSYAESSKIQEFSVDKIDFYSPQGKKRLIESKYNNDFFQLVNFYQPQINPLYCGIATSVILLNALNESHEIKSQKEAEILKPKIYGGDKIEFHEYLQSNFLNDETNKIKRKEIIELKAQKINKKGEKFYDAGLSLTNLADILSKTHKLKVKKIFAKRNDEKSINKFRNYLKKYLADDKYFIVANFYGKRLKNKTGGHISPIGAYHEKSDSVLVLDVALHKDRWYFVSVKDLYSAMNSKDGDNYRGYLIVTK